MKKFFLICALFVFLALPVGGQTPEAKKLDEFGTIPCDEYLAHVDLITQTQAENPDAKIYVFVYEGSEKKPVYIKEGIVEWKSILPPYGLAKTRIESLKRHLKLRKIPLRNYVFANGGFREDFTVEAWLVSPGAKPPKPTPTLEKIKYRKGKAQGFSYDCGN